MADDSKLPATTGGTDVAEDKRGKKDKKKDKKEKKKGGASGGEELEDDEEGGALSLTAAVNIQKKRPYPEGLRTLLSTLSVMDWDSPPAFTAKRSEIEAGESLLVSYLQETFGHGLRSLKFIRQLGV